MCSLSLTDVYVDTKPVTRYYEHHCICKRPADPMEKGCGENCLNRWGDYVLDIALLKLVT